MISSNIKKAFVKGDDTATIHCPECHLAKTVAVGKFRSVRHTIKARCACGHSFSVSLEFRKCYRKKTELEGRYETKTEEVDTRTWKKTKLTGTYYIQAPTAGNGHIVVTNISCGGLQFTIHGSHTLNVGQEVQIAFTLDDRNHTEINKLVIILSVADNIIGCRFAGNEPLGQALSFYLFP